MRYILLNLLILLCQFEMYGQIIKGEVGATGFNRLSGWSGWGGMHARKGFEIGTKIELGNRSVKIKSLHVLLHRQAFDTSFYRLHFRSIQDTLILDELLTENIIISITNESGWTQIDLEPYNLILSGDVGLTLEWLKIQGINKDQSPSMFLTIME